MRGTSKSLFERVADGAWRAFLPIVRSRRARQLDRLYGPLPARELPPSLDLAEQASRLAAIVTAHCTIANDIVGIQNSATIKLDATEYAFSSMLEELRGVMRDMPTDWTPRRARSLTEAGDIEMDEALAA